MIGLLANSEVPVHDSAGVKRMGLRIGTDFSISLVRYNSSGVEQETVLSIDGTTGVISPTGNLAYGYRELVDAAAVTLAATDAVIRVTATTTATTAATMTATYAGHVIDVIMTAGDADSVVTLVVTQGTITLNAAGEGCRIIYDGSDWNLVALTGGATIA
jgi:hypothetical protein